MTQHEHILAAELAAHRTVRPLNHATAAQVAIIMAQAILRMQQAADLMDEARRLLRGIR